MAEGDVGDDPATEVGVGGGLLGAVEELVDEDDVARAVLFLERPDGADTEDPGDAELLERPDVGAMGKFRGEEAMSATVAGEEHDVASGEAAGEKLVGGWAEGGFDLDPAGVGESVDVVEAGATDDPDAMRLPRHAGWV